MKIIEEMQLEVANAIHTGNCRLIVVDRASRELWQMADSLNYLMVDGVKRHCFIARATVQENDRISYRINIYVLEDVEGTLLGKSVTV